MEQETNEELFIGMVGRINRYLIIMGIFFLGYFIFNTKPNIYLFLLALLNLAFSLLSHKHLEITGRLTAELRRAKTTMEDVSREIRDIHQG
jgi:hypothetical protein